MSNYPFWLGGVAASLAASCTHPLDLTKVFARYNFVSARASTNNAVCSRMQTYPSSVPRPSTINVLRAAVAEAGFLSLYTGLTAALLRQMTYSLVRIGSYEALKEKMSDNGKLSTSRMIIAASLAGALGGLAGNPADIILVRMTSDVVRPPEKRYGYSNAISGLSSLIRKERLQGLARGLGTNSARAILMNASQVGSYDIFKNALLNRPIPIFQYQFQDNLFLHIIASTMAGTVATTVCAPADVLRSRVMSSSSDTSILQICRQSLREEGPRFLFKGWTPAFVRLAPNTILLFVFYEQIKKAWRSTLT